MAKGTRVAIVLELLDARLTAMRAAISDPLFLADLEEEAKDVKYIDAEAPGTFWPSRFDATMNR